MALDLIQGLTNCKVSFFHEPGETIFIIEVAEGIANYELRFYRDFVSWDMGSLDNYEKLFSGTTTPARIIQQINALLFKTFTDVGPDAYKERWIEHDFPTAKYHKLLNAK